MAELFAWYRLIFEIPIVVGILMLLGSAFGVGEMGGDHDLDIDADADVDMDVDTDIDVDADADVDHDVEHEVAGGGFGNNPFSWILLGLGVGKAPLSVIFMTGAFLFGGIGTISNIFLEPLIKIFSPFALISLGIALIGSFFLTGVIARLISRCMPSTESYNIRKESLVGCLGEAVIPITDEGGIADIRDEEQNVHRITCYVQGDCIPKGTEIITIDYEEDQDRYIVQPSGLNG